MARGLKWLKPSLAFTDGTGGKKDLMCPPPPLTVKRAQCTRGVVVTPEVEVNVRRV